MSEITVKIPKDIPSSLLKKKIDELVREEEVKWVLFERCKEELSLEEDELDALDGVREKVWKETKKKYEL